MKTNLICVCVLLSTACSFAAFGGVYKSSALFPHQYNADTLMDPLNGPYTNDTTVRWSNAASHYVSSNTAYWTNVNECSGVFIRHKLGSNAALFDISTGFTIELKAAIASQSCDEAIAKWGLMLETAANGLRLDFRVYTGKLLINGTSITAIGSDIFNGTNRHTVRITYAPNDTHYTVWVDNISIGRFAAVQASPVNRFYFGDLGSAQEGMLKLDYIRIDDTGAYNPQIDIELEETDGKTVVAETGQNGTDQYQIRLRQNPASPFSVICTPQSTQLSLNSQAGGAPCIISFQPAAEGSLPHPQTVYVSAINDGIRQNRRYSTISHTSESTDPSLTGMVIPDINVVIEPDQWCGQTGTTYTAADINRDCEVNLYDMAMMAAQWLGCTNPANPDCELSTSAAMQPNIFGTIYNYDGDFSFSSYDPELSILGINMLIDSLTGTSVKSIAYSIASGSDIMNYPSSVSSTWGWRVTSQESDANIGTRVAKGRACIAAGLDAVRTAALRAKQNGMFFFPSLRMNDYHYVSDPQNSFLTGQFWIENQNTLTIKASGGQSPIIGKPDCDNLLDFTYPQVRQYRLGVINEVIDRNQDVIDGFELDFSRSFVFFPKDTAAANSHLMTDLVQQVKERLTLLESQNGRQYYLIARIPPTIEKCYWAGIDIEQWLQDELVDIIVPSELMTTYFEMPVDEFAALARGYGSKCRVFGGLYPRVGWEWPFTATPTASTYTGAPSVTISSEMTRAAAGSFFNQGADGLYCYNFGLPRTDAEFKRLKDLDSSNCLTGENKVYPVTKSFWLDYEDTSLPPKQLPAQLQTGTPLQFEIQVSEQTNPRIARNALQYCGIRLGLREVASSDIMLLKINGSIIHSADLSQEFIDVAYPDFGSGSYSPAARMFWQKQLTDTSMLNSGTNIVEMTFNSLSGTAPLLTDINIGFIYTAKSTAGLYVDE